MARDVELDITANDKTAAALASAERRFKSTNDRIQRDQERAFKNFQKTASTIAGSGSAIGALFGENFAKALSRAAPAAVPILAGVAIGAAPLIGATVAGAIIGGVGIGGVIGGVVLAARDPRVKTAGVELGNSLLGQLRTRAAVFVDPVLAAIKDVQAGFDDVSDDIGRIFANAARFVRPLTQAVTFVFQRITQAADRLTAKAGPVIDALSNSIAGLGDAVADVFESLEDDGVSAAVALRQTFAIVEATIRGVGAAINVLTESYGFLAKVGAFGREAQLEYHRLQANAKIAAEANRDVAASLGTVHGAGSRAAGAIAALAAAVGDLNAENRTLYGSETAVAEAIDRATDSARENGKTLDKNTEGGRANRRALEGIATAAAAQYAAYVKVNGEGEGANRVMEENRRAFIKAAQSMGLSKKEAEALAAKLGLIPAKKETKTKVETTEAEARIKRLEKRLDGIEDETVRINIIVNERRRSKVENQLERNGRDFAAGDSWAGRDLNSGGMSRTGGPAEVSVAQTLNVSLDGAPFYAYTARAVAESERRQEWRAKVRAR